ncbi:MAG: 4'-phosphopantetheinyl transferase superfamily protein [Phyllobacterium sp.]|uniref:4'-phosphopantetheinyl transferase family protein n=1 Tax=Phyllobacterium sp. TaxID=1871046 RepID=UPI0030F30957
MSAGALMLPCEPLEGLPRAIPINTDAASIDIWWWAYDSHMNWRKALSCLAQDERNRAEAFRFERDAVSFVAGRCLQRSVLSAYTGTPADELVFTTGVNGKPTLVGGQESVIFNLSNAQGLVVLAIGSKCQTVGIDAESLSATIQATAASMICSSAELSYLSRLRGEAHQSALLAFWVLKESYLKAKGIGLGQALDQITVRLDPETQEIRVDDDVIHATPCQHRLFLAPRGHLVAVSVATDQAKLLFRQHVMPDPDDFQ